MSKQAKVTKQDLRISKEIIEAIKNGTLETQYNLIEKGTRAKTEAKIISMQEQCPQLAKAYDKIQAIYQEVMKERFVHEGIEYKLLVTLKK